MKVFSVKIWGVIYYSFQFSHELFGGPCKKNVKLAQRPQFFSSKENRDQRSLFFIIQRLNNVFHNMIWVGGSPLKKKTKKID